MKSNDLKLNLLVAYPYFTSKIGQIIKENQHNIRFVLDSGAFTAWKAGKPIALDDYCRFLDSLPIKPWRYFNLDVIGDPEASLNNYEIMRSRGYKPVPIFTRGDKAARLEQYYETSDVVGVGGLVGTRGNRGFVNGVMRQAKGRKIHLLGFTPNDFIKFHRPYMCDSSAWSMCFRFGSLSVYKGRGEFTTIKRTSLKDRPSEDDARACARLGVSIRDLAFRDGWLDKPTAPAKILAARSWVNYSLDVRRNVGTLVFMAAVDDCDVMTFVRARDYIERTFSWD